MSRYDSALQEASGARSTRLTQPPKSRFVRPVHALSASILATRRQLVITSVASADSDARGGMSMRLLQPHITKYDSALQEASGARSTRLSQPPKFRFVRAVHALSASILATRRQLVIKSDASANSDARGVMSTRLMQPHMSNAVRLLHARKALTSSSDPHWLRSRYRSAVHAATRARSVTRSS